MWTHAEVIEDIIGGVIYYGVVMQETVGVFKVGEKIDALILVASETAGHYTLEEWNEDGGISRTQEVKLVACE